MYHAKMLINGEAVDALSGKVSIIRNPANQEVVADFPHGSRQDAARALEAASAAFPKWSKTSSQERADLLHRAADLVRERVEEISIFLTREMGKPIRNSRSEVMAASEVLDYYAEEGKRILGEWITLTSGKGGSLVLRQPVGVAALITPWNFPVDLLSWKVAPALAAGCTIVAKPPSLAPLAASALVQAVHDAGAPPGVVNTVTGPGEEVGAELVENPLSRKVAFTGETSTGRWIMVHAAPNLKRLSLELGGQSPFIVCADAHLPKAARDCARRAFSNMGQVCISVNRVYVDHEVLEEFTSRLVEEARGFRIGDGMNPEVELGPMASEAQRQKTRDHVADALEKGARLVLGGREPEGEEYSQGYFFLPTILSHVNHSMRVTREETFGPVAPIIGFSGLDQALAMANDTDYGLAAYVYTRDLDTAFRMAKELQAGGVGINHHNVSELQAPFGGWKQSGLGRELGTYGLDAFLEIKHVRFGT